MSDDLPGSWEKLEPNLSEGYPGYHAPAQDPAPYAKVYAAPYADDHEFVAIAYPEGSDVRTNVKLGEHDSQQAAEDAIIEWITETE